MTGSSGVSVCAAYCRIYQSAVLICKPYLRALYTMVTDPCKVDTLIIMHGLYPTYDVDQGYHQGNIQYVILCCNYYSTYPSGQTQTPHLYLLQLLDTNQLMHPNQCCMDNALVR